MEPHVRSPPKYNSQLHMSAHMNVTACQRSSLHHLLLSPLSGVFLSFYYFFPSLFLCVCEIQK